MKLIDDKLKKLESISKLNSVKLARWVLLITFIFLVVFDVVLVILNDLGIPTISRVVLNSSPRFVVVIMIFGILTSNVFFPRQRKPSVKKIHRFLILAAFGLVFIGLGHYFHGFSKEVECGEIEKHQREFKWKLLDVHCLLLNDNFAYVDCENPEAGCVTKVNFKVEIKFLIFVFGMILGYYFWPQEFTGESSNDNEQLT